MKRWVRDNLNKFKTDSKYIQNYKGTPEDYFKHELLNSSDIKYGVENKFKLADEDPSLLIPTLLRRNNS